MSRDARPANPIRSIVVLALSLVLLLAGCSSADDPEEAVDDPSEGSVVDVGDVDLHPYELLDLARPGDTDPVLLADPGVIKVDDTWYLYGTTGSDGFEMWSSTDLADWEYGGYVWKPTEGSWNVVEANGSGTHWAPEPFVNDDGVWLYYTSNVRIGVARADTPEGPFVDQLDHPLIGNGYGGVGDGVLPDAEDTIVGNFDDRAWDAWMHEASSGDLYLYFSAMTPFSEMRVIPMVDEITPADVEPTVVVAAEGNLDTWEGWVREGPAVIERDGVTHVMYSGNAWSNVCYAIGVATATDPLGPFERQEDNPVLATDVDTALYAPGHNCMVAGPNGETLAFFHVKLDDGLFGPRRPMYAPITFDDDGNLRFVDAPNTTPPGTPLCLEPTL